MVLAFSNSFVAMLPTKKWKFVRSVEINRSPLQMLQRWWAYIWQANKNYRRITKPSAVSIQKYWFNKDRVQVSL